MKINSDFEKFASVRFDPAQYIPSPSYGVNRFMLDRIGDEKARATTIVEYQPNSSFPKHTHIGGEEFLVLKGTFCDQYGKFPSGTYVRNPIDSQHEPWVEQDGCTILVKLLQMADTTETEPLHITIDENRAEKTSFGKVQQLYSNKLTCENVEMCWLDPNTKFTADNNGGQEIFIVHGSVTLNNETFNSWDWLRFPVGDDTCLCSGDNGALLYRKTNHLTPKALSMERIQVTG